jgi:hypothetical protein
VAGLEGAIERARLLAWQESGLAVDLARALSGRIDAMADRSLIPEVLRTFIATVDDATLLATLHVLTQRGRSGDPRYRRVAIELALNSQMFASLEYDRLQDLYEIARGAKLTELMPLFFHAKHDPRGPKISESGPENAAMEAPLGTRKAAARGTDRDTLDRLMRDRNPQVIRLLLNNPRMRERDVVTLSAIRPTSPAVLEEVARHRKWSSCYAVRKALSCNPYTPHPIAERLMATLFKQDLRFIAGTSVLPKRVRQEARRLLGDRRTVGASRLQSPAQLRGRPASELVVPEE